jgi:hypothetical protein
MLYGLSELRFAVERKFALTLLVRCPLPVESPVVVSKKKEEAAKRDVH